MKVFRSRNDGGNSKTKDRKPFSENVGRVKRKIEETRDREMKVEKTRNTYSKRKVKMFPQTDWLENMLQFSYIYSEKIPYTSPHLTNAFVLVLM